MTNNNKILLINNPISGRQRLISREDRLRGLITNCKKDIKFINTEYAGHANEIVLNAIDEGIKHFIVSGGDGTINEVGKHLAGNSDLSMGIIPCGSGNGLAKSLHLPSNLENAFDIAIRNTIKAIDIGVLNENKFLSIAGIGFDAEIAEDFAKAKGRGLMNYVKAIIKKYPSYKEKEYTITLPNRVINTKALFISFANSNQFGNGVKISPNSIITDGKIDICIMKKIPTSEVMLLTPLLFMEQIQKTKYLDIISCETAKIHTQTKTIIHIDGDPIDLNCNEFILTTMKQVLNIHI